MGQSYKMYTKKILIALATVMAVATAYYEQSTETYSGMSGTNHHSNQMPGSMSSLGSYSSGNSGMSHHSSQMSGRMSSGDYARGNSDISGMNHQSNQMLGSISSSGNYDSGNSGMSGINHGSNLMQGSMSSGGYSSGSARRNMHQSTGTGSQSNMNMPSSFLSLGSQSIPEIGYLEEVISEADNSNTVFIQNHGSAGNNGMQNHGSSGSYGVQNRGSSGRFATQNHGEIS